MRQWSWVPNKGSSWGSAITVENRGAKLLSVGVVVRYHAPTENQYTSRQLQGNRSLKKIKKRLNFKICKVHCPSCRVLWPKRPIQEKFYIVYCQFNRGAWMGVKVRKINNQKTDRLQKSDWSGKRLDIG